MRGDRGGAQNRRDIELASEGHISPAEAHKRILARKTLPGVSTSQKRLQRVVAAQYENPSTEGTKIGPKAPSVKKMAHYADIATTGGLGQVIADRFHGKKATSGQKLTVGIMAGAGGGKGGPEVRLIGEGAQKHAKHMVASRIEESDYGETKLPVGPLSVRPTSAKDPSILKTLHTSARVKGGEVMGISPAVEGLGGGAHRLPGGYRNQGPSWMGMWPDYGMKRSHPGPEGERLLTSKEIQKQDAEAHKFFRENPFEDIGPDEHLGSRKAPEGHRFEGMNGDQGNFRGGHIGPLPKIPDIKNNGGWLDHDPETNELGKYVLKFPNGSSFKLSHADAVRAQNSGVPWKPSSSSARLKFGSPKHIHIPPTGPEDVRDFTSGIPYGEDPFTKAQHITDREQLRKKLVNSKLGAVPLNDTHDLFTESLASGIRPLRSDYKGRDGGWFNDETFVKAFTKALLEGMSPGGLQRHNLFADVKKTRLLSKALFNYHYRGRN